MRIKDLLDGRNSIENMCNMARELGYHDPCSQLYNKDGSCVGDFLYFLEDNPGAMESLMGWITENCICTDCNSRIEDCICNEIRDDDEQEDEAGGIRF